MGNSNPLPLIPEDPSLPSTQKIQTLSSPVHVLPSSFQVSEFYLGFLCNCTSKTEIIVTFFMYENGMALVQDSTRPLSSQDFQIEAGYNIKLKVRLNQAYIDEFTYEAYSSFPIVIQANTNSWSEVTILEIKSRSPRVLQQRVIINQQLYAIREIVGVPVSDSETRDTLCVVCLFNTRDTILEPCCHFYLCHHCANLIRTQVSRRCPMCRKGNSYVEIQSFISVQGSSIECLS